MIQTRIVIQVYILIPGKSKYRGQNNKSQIILITDILIEKCHTYMYVENIYQTHSLKTQHIVPNTMHIYSQSYPVDCIVEEVYGVGLGGACRGIGSQQPPPPSPPNPSKLGKNYVYSLQRSLDPLKLLNLKKKITKTAAYFKFLYYNLYVDIKLNYT